jgi:hypothetical protein
MEKTISGAGFMFLGSGCGPALSDEQRAFLKQAKPDQFYSLARLLEMYEAAARSNSDLLYATGRRWGAALKEDLIQRGAANTKEALHLTEDVYREHHQGEVGRLIVEDDGETAVRITNTGPHPLRLVAGVYQAIATTFSERHAEFSMSEAERVIRVSWSAEDQPA